MKQVDVMVREVGLRDGLQIHPTFMPTEQKLAWIAAESAAGVAEIEVTSYVPPKLIPQFADAEAVTRGALEIPGLLVAALIPNLRGAERGVTLGARKLNFVMSVSRTHNQKNVRREREESGRRPRRHHRRRQDQRGQGIADDRRKITRAGEIKPGTKGL